MKAYRKPAGHYIELEDNVPVSESLVRVAPKPSSNHVFSETWNSSPMDPAVCWRLKTTQELDSEKQDQATNRPDPILLQKARAQVDWASIPALKTAFPTYQEYQAAIINRYKTLI